MDLNSTLNALFNAAGMNINAGVVGGEAAPPLFGGGANNLLANMFTSAITPPYRVTQAKRLDLEWKTRGDSLYQQLNDKINRKRRKLEKMFYSPAENTAEKNNDNAVGEEQKIAVEPEEDKVTKIIKECEQIEKDIMEIEIIIKQQEPLLVEQARKIAELELQLYEEIMATAREKIIAEQQRRAEIQRLSHELFEQIEDKWESGVPDADIKIFISEHMRKLYPKFTEASLERYTAELFRMGTQHLDVRIWLTPEQINQIPLKKVSELDDLAENPQCHSCLEDLAPTDEVRVLPCDPKHVFHPQCIDPWFKKKTTCPLCKKDMREWVDPEYETRKSEPEEDGEDNEEAEAAAVAHDRQLELIQQFLRSVFM